MSAGIKVAAGTVAVGALVWGWIAGASAIYCYGYDVPSKFRFPYGQWIAAVRWWNYSDDVTLWVAIGAIIPTLLLGLIILAVARQCWPKKRSAVYGKTEWATREQKDAAGISSKPRPF